MDALDPVSPPSAEDDALEDDARAEAPPAPLALAPGRSPLDVLRRVTPRALVRSAFWLFFVWSCVQLWRYYQWALGAGPFVTRPEATAGFVPLGAFMSLFAWLKSGVFDPVMPAAVVIIIGAIVLSVLFKRGFCGWICPVGTTVSAFGWLGRKVFGRNLRVGRKTDIALRVPKYLITTAILVQLASLPAEVGLQFQMLPYYATSDMKILYVLLHPAPGYLVLAAFIAATSMTWGNTWCRYLCPLGALYGLFGVASAGTVARDADACIACGKCTKACDARIDVAEARVVRSPECDGCMDCVRECPQPGALTARMGPARVPWQAWPVALVVTWLLVWSVALAGGHWRHGLPEETVAEYMRIMKTTADMPSGQQ